MVGRGCADKGESNFFAKALDEITIGEVFNRHFASAGGVFVVADSRDDAERDRS